MQRKFTAIDLFSGAGGLSLGFMQTQKYDIKVAFENNPSMQETYRRNHPAVDVRGDVCSADYSAIQAEYGPIDVVIGGPPCQGFSNANRQRSNAISKNNMLVKQYIRAIRELQPLGFVMENVSMLRSDTHRFYLDETDKQLFEQGGYIVPMTSAKLLLLDKQYLFDGAVDIVKSPEHIHEYILSEDQYAVLNVIYKSTKNPQKMINALSKHEKQLRKYIAESLPSSIGNPVQCKIHCAFTALKEYYEGSLQIDQIKARIEPAIMIQRMLSKANEIFENHIVVDNYAIDDGLYASIRSYAVFDYIKAILGSSPNSYAIKAQVLCAADFGAPQKRMRFVVMGIKLKLRTPKAC